MAKAHVSLNVRDLGASVAFYRSFLGTEPVKLKPDYAKFDLQDPPLNLTMNLRAPGALAGDRHVGHLGLQVENHEGVEAARQRLLAAQLLALDEADTVCCYARQEKVWATDPDGNAWEVFHVIEAEVESPSFASTTPESAPCCAPPTAGPSSACCA